MSIVADATAPEPTPFERLRSVGAPRAPSQTPWQPDAPAALLVLGTVRGDWTIGHVSTDVTDLLGYLPDALLGRSAWELVHPDDATILADVAVRSRHLPGGSLGQARFAAANGGWIPCRFLLQPLAADEDAGLAFAMSRAAGDSISDKLRVRELEERLRRIAREVSASGVAWLTTTLPTSMDVPELHQLTSREYEIVVRLSSGERVPTIARGLFLSESTVRNHLTAVYRKFGVRSQAELVTRLQSSDASRPEADEPHL